MSPLARVIERLRGHKLWPASRRRPVLRDVWHNRPSDRRRALAKDIAAALREDGHLNVRCLTPGAVFHTRISADEVSCRLDLPAPLILTKTSAAALEAALHDAVEAVLAPYWGKGSGSLKDDGERGR